MVQTNSVLASGWERDRLNARQWVAICIIFLLYIGFRVLIWRNTVLLEDHDSTGLLRWAIPFLELDFKGVLRLDPDASLFYPFLIALFSWPGWSLEAGARLASLVSGVVLFGAMLGIGRQIAAPAAILVGLLFLAFNPEIAALYVAVLTEPSYVATVYLGLMLFWWQYRQPTLGGAALLGVIFGLAFLNRLEGILFAGFVPVMLCLYYLWYRPPSWGWQRLVGWCVVFLACFAVLAGLQILRVSHEMGALAVNGRQVWTLLMHSPTVGSGYLEQIYGLYFDPAQVNMKYLKQNFAAASSLATEQVGFGELARSYARTLWFNLNDLYSVRLTILFGHLVVIFFAFGLMHLLRAGRFFEVVLILAFICLGLLAPLLHNVVIRHILVVAPIILLVAGIGMVSVAEMLASLRPGAASVVAPGMVAALALVVVGSWGMPIRAALKPPDSNREYSWAELREPVRLVSGAGLHDPRQKPRVMARRAYLAQYAGAVFVTMPYGSYDQLVEYSALNSVDLLYLNSDNARFPFTGDFATDRHREHFTLVYQGEDAQGAPVALYRFHPPETH